jgi:hypothetical protein
MDLQTIKTAAEYSSLGLYGIGVLGFLIFALVLLRTSFKHFAITTLLAPVWPAFVIVALIRGDKKKGPPKYIEIGR